MDADVCIDCRYVPGRSFVQTDAQTKGESDDVYEDDECNQARSFSSTSSRYIGIISRILESLPTWPRSHPRKCIAAASTSSLGGPPRNLFLRGRVYVGKGVEGRGRGALAFSAMMDNLWPRELTREPVLLRRGALAQ